MKLLYFSDAYFSNHGGRTHAREFFAALHTIDGIAEASVFPLTVAPRKEGVAGVRVPYHWRLLASFFLRGSKYYPELARYLKRRPVDWLILRATVHTTLMISLLKRDFPRMRICVEFNASPFQEELKQIPLNRVFRRFEVMQYARADLILCVSASLRDYLLDFDIDSRRVIVAHNGVNPQHFSPGQAATVDVRQKNRIPGSAFVVGYLGGMEPFRRLPSIVDAIADLRRDGHQELYLMMVGDGEQMLEVQQRVAARALDLEGRVLLPGRQSYDLCPAVVAAFDVAVFPFSNPYGSPQKLFEYLALERPTIGPDVEATREIFVDGRDMLLVDGTEAFKRALVRLKEQPELRSRIARQGAERVLNHYTWRHQAQAAVDAMRHWDQRCGL